jgi:hypothetical protein
MAAAKLAVRAYARDPSSDNAAEVALALERVRRLTSVAERRRPTVVGGVPSPPATGRPETLTDAR